MNVNRASHRRYALALSLLVLLVLLALQALPTAPAQAQQFERFGDIEAHYSAITTDFLPEEMARRLDIQRSPHQGLVSLSVRDADGQALNVATEGSVSVVGKPGETPLAFRTLREGDGISRYATFAIDTSAPMRFRLSLQLDRNASPEAVSFLKRFYRDQ